MNKPKIKDLLTALITELIIADDEPGINAMLKGLDGVVAGAVSAGVFGTEPEGVARRLRNIVGLG